MNVPCLVHGAYAHPRTVRIQRERPDLLLALLEPPLGLPAVWGRDAPVAVVFDARDGNRRAEEGLLPDCPLWKPTEVELVRSF